MDVPTDMLIGCSLRESRARVSFTQIRDSIWFEMLKSVSPQIPSLSRLLTTSPSLLHLHISISTPAYVLFPSSPSAGSGFLFHAASPLCFAIPESSLHLSAGVWLCCCGLPALSVQHQHQGYRTLLWHLLFLTSSFPLNMLYTALPSSFWLLDSVEL